MYFLDIRLVHFPIRSVEFECVVTGQSFSGSIAVSDCWCFHLYRVVTDIEDRKSKRGCQFLWLNRHVLLTPYLDPKLKIFCIAKAFD